MHLLASCEDIVCDAAMPYERRYLAYFVAVSQTSHIPWSQDGETCIDLDELARGSLAGLWAAFSEAAALGSPDRPPLYYPEKSLGELDAVAAAGIPFRLIDVVRDPRDIYVSARAVAGRLGRPMFGVRPDQPDAVNVALFLHDIAARAGEIGAAVAGVEPVRLRYEDMVADLSLVRRVLGDALGLVPGPHFGPPVAGAHMTSASAAASVGRWRTELDPAVAALMTRMLAPQLAALGYPLE